ncbi:BamA/TamA family outer membrane protein [Frigidibacter sp. RF13]|uniref:autotransporter assembly complex protein TamA n=1 Tax=Frigidibacter sp. RF13 TaxID=2997340 RepID=UPI00226DFF78|nr:BamA/TamA family outer membrane protein [Frigidibacter sp. RF13]MCY1126416.1 BamA/TamA family outer membrane protein [Frigidibacter sp. RF13]
MRRAACLSVCLCLAVAGLQSVAPTRGLAAEEMIGFAAPGADKTLTRALMSASLLVAAGREGTTDPQDILAAALSDYARLTKALYAEGYYGGVIHIRIDGREAADIPLLDAPTHIDHVSVTVTPGPPFRFGAARMAPYAPGTDLPPGYRDGQIARATAIGEAAEAGIAGWRKLGYAKARVAGQDITADHATALIDARLTLASGPRLTFGALEIEGIERLPRHRVVKIAGYRQGQVFDPEVLEKMASRLRRTGIYRSVSVREAAEPNQDGTLDILLELDEEVLHRFGFGAEVNGSDGASLSAFWLHRNLLGGGERLRLDGLIKGIDGDAGFTEYELGARIERPGTPFTDSSVFAETRFDRVEILDLDIRSLTFSLGAIRTVTDDLTLEAGLSYQIASIEDSTFRLDYRLLALPVSLEWDRRGDKLDPVDGYYLKTSVTPFAGFGTADSGTGLSADARYYKGFGARDQLVFAGRVQLATTLGTSLTNTSPDYLYYSGGGGTVRGQPFESLGVPVSAGGSSYLSGGLSRIALSGEIRGRINDRVGAVAFYDAGYVSDAEWFGGNSEWQSGAGLGLRYDTGFGPVRLDVAFPLSGSTGDGMQVYVGIGQAF